MIASNVINIPLNLDHKQRLLTTITVKKDGDKYPHFVTTSEKVKSPLFPVKCHYPNHSTNSIIPLTSFSTIITITTTINNKVIITFTPITDITT